MDGELKLDRHSVFIGVDGEMTGSDGTTLRPEEKYQLIQIGVATKKGEHFVSDIGYDKYEFLQASLDVTGFTDERIRGGPPSEAVDGWLVKWLDERGLIRGLIPVGFGVSYWDMPFVRKYLPAFTTLLSHRSVELGAVCATLSLVHNIPAKKISRKSKEYARVKLIEEGVPSNWHDAGYDARAALYSWEYLRHLTGQTTEAVKSHIHQQIVTSNLEPRI